MSVFIDPIIINLIFYRFFKELSIGLYDQNECATYFANTKMNTSIKGFILFVLAGIITFGFIGCDKDDDETPKSLLTGKQWNLTSWISTPPFEVEGQMISNIYTLLPVCSYDDYYVFNTDGSMIKDEGDIKCNEYQPQTISGSWLINSNQTILKLTFENDETNYTISEISDNFLILKTEEVIEDVIGSVTYEYLLTYTRM